MAVVQSASAHRGVFAACGQALGQVMPRVEMPKEQCMHATVFFGCQLLCVCEENGSSHGCDWPDHHALQTCLQLLQPAYRLWQDAVLAFSIFEACCLQ